MRGSGGVSTGAGPDPQTADRRGEIDILVGLSEVYRRYHREAPAIAAIEQALAMARELGDRAARRAASPTGSISDPPGMASLSKRRPMPRRRYAWPGRLATRSC